MPHRSGYAQSPLITDATAKKCQRDQRYTMPVAGRTLRRVKEKNEVFGVVCSAMGVLDDKIYLCNSGLNFCLNHKVTGVTWAVPDSLFNHNYPEKFMWKSEFGGIKVLETSCNLKSSASFLDLGHPDHLLNLPLTDLLKYFFGRITDLVDQ